MQQLVAIGKGLVCFSLFFLLFNLFSNFGCIQILSNDHAGGVD